MSASLPSSRPRSGLPGRTVALLASAAQVVAIFLTWSADGTLALDVGLFGLEATASQPTLAVALVSLAALPAVAALAGDSGWPRALSGAVTGGLVLVWLAFGPDGRLTPGVLTALGAAVGHIGAAALATGPFQFGPRTEEERWNERWGATPGPDEEGQRAPARRAHEGRDGSFGHRLVPHTADLIVEAWGPTRAACFGEAVRGLVASFADTTDAATMDTHETHWDGIDDEDLLVDLLDEVIYLLDARGLVPVGGRVLDRDDGGIDVRFDLADVETVQPSGAVPKATTYHGLEVQREAGRWTCRVTIDV